MELKLPVIRQTEFRRRGFIEDAIIQKIPILWQRIHFFFYIINPNNPSHTHTHPHRPCFCKMSFSQSEFESLVCYGISKLKFGNFSAWKRREEKRGFWVRGRESHGNKSKDQQSWTTCKESIGDARRRGFSPPSKTLLGICVHCTWLKLTEFGIPCARHL